MSDTTTDPNAPLGAPQAPPQQPNPTAGFLNQSPDFWRTLASFGGNMAVAANARTPGGFLQYGSGLAGPMGAAVIGAMETQRQNALTASALGLQRANTADVQSQVQQRALQNRALQRQQDLLTSIWGPSGGAAPNQAPTPGQAAPAGGGQGGGQAPAQGGTQGGFDAFAAAPPALKPMIQTAAQRYGMHPQLLAGVLQQESGMGQLSPNLGQILPATAANPGYGLPPLAPEKITDPESNVNFTAAYLNKRGQAAGVKDWNDPQQAAVGLTAYNGGGDPNYVPHVARYAPSVFGGQSAEGSARPPTPPPPQANATQIARDILTGANPNYTPEQARIAAPLIAMLPGQQEFAKHLTEFGDAGRQAGSVAQAQEPSQIRVANAKPQTLRPGGATYFPSTGETIQAPVPQRTIVPSGPNAGSEQLTYPTPPILRNGQPMNGAPVAPVPAAPDSPGAASSSGGATPGNRPLITKMSPFQQAQQDESAKALGTANTEAGAAVQNNAMWDVMRQRSQTWDMGKFADVSGELKSYFSASAHALGVSVPNLDQSLADQQNFTKDAINMVGQFTRQVSPRAAFSEMQFLQGGMPTATTSARAFGQIADQMQSLNDYKIAKQQFASQYQGDPKNWEADFNQKITPGAFLLNRMAQTPDGQADLISMNHTLSQTPEGQKRLAQLHQEYLNAQPFFPGASTQGATQPQSAAPQQSAQTAPPISPGQD